MYDADGRAHPLPESALPVELPDIPDYAPVQFDPDDADSEPSPPLAKATDWVHVEMDLGDGFKSVHPRHQRDAAVGGQLVVRAAIHRPVQQRRVVRQGERGVLDGPAAGRTRPEGPRRRRSVRRRRRACGAASAVCAVLAQGAVRPRPRQLQGAVPPAGEPGLHPGVRLHRLPRRVRARGRGHRTRWQVLLARARTARSRSSRSSARSARA